MVYINYIEYFYKYLGCAGITAYRYSMNNDRLKNEYIRILKEQIEQSGIKFKYFATITYRFKQTSLSKVSSDNAELRRTIRSFYDEPIRVWSFIEEHLDPTVRTLVDTTAICSLRKRHQGGGDDLPDV